VLAYDVATPPLERFVGQGGRQASHPAQIGAECQRVLVMVVNGAQVEEVVQGEHGLLQKAMPVTSLSLALYQLAHDKLGGLRNSTEVVRYFLDN
jgi:3-hydroxyisobutyrate dehydrogenase-like beta-hydroxyacid dehydrogenase